MSNIVQHADGMANALTGLGGETDKGQSVYWTGARDLGQTEADNVYMGSSYMRTAIDTAPNVAIQAGWEWCADNGAFEDFDDLMEAEEKRLRVPQALAAADKASRQYGGGAVILGIEDGRDFSLPVDEANIVRVAWVRRANRHELIVNQWDDDPISPNFGNPLTYLWIPRFSATAQRTIHWTRLVRFEGDEVPDDVRLNRQSWGCSLLELAKPKIERLESVEQAIAAIIQEYQWSTLKINQLAEIVSDAEGSKKLGERLLTMRMGRGITKMNVIDAQNEDISRDTATVTGLADLFDRACRAAASAARMPLSLFLGIGPGGLNTTGKDDAGEQWFFQSVATSQKNRYEPALMVIGRYIQLAKNGPIGELVDGAKVEFKPLRLPTEAEKADVELKRAQTHQIYLSFGVIDPAEVRDSVYGGSDGDVELDDVMESEDDTETEDDANAITAENDAVMAALVAELTRAGIDVSKLGVMQGNEVEGDNGDGRMDAADIDLRPTIGMQDAAKRALANRAEAPPSKRGMTTVGLATARDIAAGRVLSANRWERMLSFFQRFEPLRNRAGFDRKSKLGQAWDGWGGDDGFERAAKVVAELAKAKADKRGATADVIYARSRLNRANGNLY